MTRRQRLRPTRRAVAAVAALAIALGACETPPASVAPTPTRAPEPTPRTTTYDLTTDVWYEGLVLHVGRATTVLDARGGTVDVLMTIENPNADASVLDAAISLLIGSLRLEPTRDSRVPSAPPGESRLALLSFELQGIASADEAVLEIGAEPDHVARVPFTAAAGEPVTFQPIEIEPKGSGTASELKITLQHGVIRWDLPDWSQQLPGDVRALTLTYDATYTGGFSGGFAFTGDNVALRLPDGTVVEARKDGHSQSIELIGPKKTKKNLFSRFEIPVDATGEFALLVRSGSSPRAIRFTIEG